MNIVNQNNLIMQTDSIASNYKLSEEDIYFNNKLTAKEKEQKLEELYIKRG